MSEGSQGGDGGGAMSAVSAIWGSSYTEPSQAENGAKTTTRIPVPSKFIGILQPGDLIGRPGVIGEGGYGTKILRVLAGAGFVIVGSALAETELTKDMAKVKKKPCAQPGLAGLLNYTPVDHKKSQALKNFLVTAVVSFPLEPVAIDLEVELVSPFGGVSAQWPYFAQGLGNIRGERNGWVVSPVGQGWEAYWQGVFTTGYNLNVFAGGGFDLYLRARVNWPPKDEGGHPICDTSPPPYEAPFLTYKSRLVVVTGVSTR